MTIEEFVKNDYALAVAELAKIKKTPLLKTLQRGASNYNTDKLIYELTKAGFNPDEVETSTQTIPAGSVIISEAELAALKEKVNQSINSTTPSEEAPKVGIIGRLLGKTDTEPTDEVLKGLHQQRVAAWKEASFTHTQLADTNLTNEDALKKCLHILHLTNEVIPGLDATEAYYIEHGKLPEVVEVTDEEPSEGSYPELIGINLYKRVETLKKNIGRDKSQRPHKVPQWEAELAARLQQLQQTGDGPAQ
jgi:hypothetical protein